MQTASLLWAGRWVDMGGALAGLCFPLSFSLLLDFELVLYLQVCIWIDVFSQKRAFL